MTTEEEVREPVAGKKVKGNKVEGNGMWFFFYFKFSPCTNFHPVVQEGRSNSLVVYAVVIQAE